VRTEPHFLDTSGGRVFAVHHRPDGTARGQVLCVPPFNEEANRCRSLFTRQAQVWADELGFGTLVVDLFGTGDSDGGHVDARWPLWLANLRAAHDWLARREGQARVIWGTRLGALLATELHRALPGPAPALLLWQPVIDGSVHLTQFLRVRMAAQLDRPQLAKETTKSMREQLASGQPLEVAGYELHPDLASAIDRARMADRAPASGTRVLWLEAAQGEPPEIGAPSRAVVDRWLAEGVTVVTQTHGGALYWQVHERVLNLDVIAHSTAFLEAQASAP
jgi:exosortase A-associated hydrolase 2